MKSKSELPPEIAEKAIQRNVVNVAKKAAAGKSLSAREVSILEVAKNSERAVIQWPSFESIAQCAALTGFPKEKLRDWKKDGAPGFRGSRVYFGDLMPWIAAKLFNPSEDIRPAVASWDDALAKQKFEERAGILVPFEKTMEILRNALTPIRQSLLAVAATMSSRCNPTDPEFARRALESWAKDTMRLLSDAEREKLLKE